MKRRRFIGTNVTHWCRLVRTRNHDEITANVCAFCVNHRRHCIYLGTKTIVGCTNRCSIHFNITVSAHMTSIASDNRLSVLPDSRKSILWNGGYCRTNWRYFLAWRSVIGGRRWLDGGNCFRFLKWNRGCMFGRSDNIASVLSEGR